MNNRVYSRRLMGLDNRVWRVMLILSFLSIGLLSYKLIDKKKCIPFTFSVRSTNSLTDTVYYTGENLTLISSNSSQSLTWDFGDKTDQQDGAYVSHKFTAPGKYIIIANAGGGCDWEKNITVINSPQTTVISEGEKILGPTTATNTTDPQFVCSVLANSYVWSVKNNPNIKPQGKGEKVKFHFPSGGIFTVQVTLDNDRLKSYTKDINVEDVLKPKNDGQPEIKKLVTTDPIPDVKIPEEKLITTEPEKDTKPKFLKIPDETFMSLLQSVQNHQKDITDFDKYLCFGGGTKVIENNNSKIKTFTILCQELSGKSKKLEIKEVHLKRDEDNCITLINIEFKKKGFLGL